MTMKAFLRRNFVATEEVNRRAILALAEPRPGGTLLDLGCGDGAFTQRVAEHTNVARSFGAEIEPSLAARAELRGIEVHHVDLADKLPFEDASIDVVHSNQVIEHLPGTDHFMRELRRVVRHDGYAIVSTNNLSSAHNIVALLIGWQPMAAHVSDERVGLGNPLNPFAGDPGVALQMHLRLFTGRALTDLARLHGFEVDAARTAGFYPCPPRVAQLATRLLPRWGAFLVQRFRPR